MVIAVVVLDADDLDVTQVQRMARELNVGETRCLTSPEASHRTHARSRIFTPVKERAYAGLTRIRHRSGSRIAGPVSAPIRGSLTL